MKVQGVEIPQAVQDDAVAYIRRQPTFRSFDLQRAIDTHPMIEKLSWKPIGLAMRVADRIIQQQRKAGNIGPGVEEKPRVASWRWIRC